MAYIEEEFLDSLPSDNPVLAIKAVIERAKEEWFSAIPGNSYEDEFQYVVEACFVVQAFLKTTYFEYELPIITEDRDSTITSVLKFFDTVYKQADTQVLSNQVQEYKRKYDIRFGTGFVYEFTDGDLKKIQELINELRGLISESTLLDDGYRRRLLAKLESLQGELHKRVSDMHWFLGLIGEAGVVLGKFGQDAKPIVDRLKEIAKIGWRTQARAENLSYDASPPLLTDDSDSEDEA